MSYIGHFAKDLPRLQKENPQNSIHNMFSFCFIEGGGFMTLGGIDNSTHTSPICYTRFSSLEKYYRVQVVNVMFGEERAYLQLFNWNK